MGVAFALEAVLPFVAGVGEGGAAAAGFASAASVFASASAAGFSVPFTALAFSVSAGGAGPGVCVDASTAGAEGEVAAGSGFTSAALVDPAVTSPGAAGVCVDGSVMAVGAVVVVGMEDIVSVVDDPSTMVDSGALSATRGRTGTGTSGAVDAVAAGAGRTASGATSLAGVGTSSRAPVVFGSTDPLMCVSGSAGSFVGSSVAAAGAGEVGVWVVPGAMASTMATAADFAVSRIPFVFPAGGSGAAWTGVFGVAGRAGAVSTLFKLPIESSSVGCSSVVVHRPSTMYL